MVVLNGGLKLLFDKRFERLFGMLKRILWDGFRGCLRG
jgi:hypothetical protein